MRDSTLCFLVKRQGGVVSDVCLAMKKRGFGEGRWNGPGGKVHHEDGESVKEAAKRETWEEIGVKTLEFEKIGELEFIFKFKEEWNQKVHVFLCEKWEGEISESEEMKPAWFSAQKLPFEKMWPDDPFWLPLVLADKKVEGKFVFGQGDEVLEKEVFSFEK